MSKETIDSLVGNSYVKLSTVVAAFTMLSGLFVKDVNFRSETKYEIREISNQLDRNSIVLDELEKRIIGRTKGGWHRDTMERWVDSTERMNPNLKLPDVWDERYDPKPR